MRRFVVASWVAVGLVTVLRAVIAARIPLSGDEAYYWEWSRHLALGYYDHPPMVAWLIALFTWGAKSVFLIRLPFVLCGLGAAIALGAFANRATGDLRAGAVVALLVSIAPFAMISFTQASPDGPYLLGWSLGLYCAIRAFEHDDLGWWIATGAAAGACTLSRILGLALLGGLVVAAFMLRRQPAVDAATHPGLKPRHAAHAVRMASIDTTHPGLKPRHYIGYVGPAAGAVAFLACIAPFAYWTATQHWAPLAFAFYLRHTDAAGAGQVLKLLGLYAMGLFPTVFVAAWIAMTQSVRRRNGADLIVAYTALPLIALCIALSFHERVEFYWANGPFLSLIAAIGLAVPLVVRRLAAFAWTVAPAAVTAAILLALMLFPLQTYKLASGIIGTPLRHSGPFEIWSFEPAARDLQKDVMDPGLWVMTDGYGLSSVLDFYGGIAPVVIGYDPQGRESRREVDVERTPSTAIFFDKEPLATRPDFQQRLALACARVTDAGRRDYYVEGVLSRSFYLTRCEGLTPAGMRALLWEAN